LFCVTDAQTDNIFAHYDSITWNQYRQKEWKALNDSAKKAFSQGINYYYLRMRAGIAHFERKNYLKALSQFKKASLLNNIDPLVKEYIFYSLLYSGRRADALLFYYNNISALESRVQFQKKAIKSISIDATYQMTTEQDPQFNVEENTTGSQIIPQNFYTAGFFIDHELSKRLILFHGGSFLRKNNYTLSQISASSETFNRFINQYQYYGGLGINTEAGIYITTAFHFLKYNSASTGLSGLNLGTETGTHLIRISALKPFSLFKTTAGFTYSKLNHGTQYQGDISIIYFPLANLDFYLSGNYYLINENLPDQNKIRSAYRTTLGFKIIDHVWTEADYFWGEIKNMSVNEAYIVYNGLETINRKADLSLIVPGNNITFIIKASLINYSSKFFLDSGFETEINTLNFNSLSFTGGIKWTF
jgi:hypothetical protein